MFGGHATGDHKEYESTAPWHASGRDDGSERWHRDSDLSDGASQPVSKPPVDAVVVVSSATAQLAAYASQAASRAGSVSHHSDRGSLPSRRSVAPAAAVVPPVPPAVPQKNIASHLLSASATQRREAIENHDALARLKESETKLAARLQDATKRMRDAQRSGDAALREKANALRRVEALEVRVADYEVQVQRMVKAAAAGREWCVLVWRVVVPSWDPPTGGSGEQEKTVFGHSRMCVRLVLCCVVVCARDVSGTVCQGTCSQTRVCVWGVCVVNLYLVSWSSIPVVNSMLCVASLCRRRSGKDRGSGEEVLAIARESDAKRIAALEATVTSVTSQRDAALDSVRSESGALEEARSYIAVLLSALAARGGVPPEGFLTKSSGTGGAASSAAAALANGSGAHGAAQHQQLLAEVQRLRSELESRTKDSATREYAAERLEQQFRDLQARHERVVARLSDLQSSGGTVGRVAQLQVSTETLRH